jgi:hypothetical protein
VRHVKETIMTVQWKKDADAVFSEARSQGRHALLDFNAAPV